MWMLSLRTLRFRMTSFAATFIALFLGAAIVMACGGLLETGLRTAVPPDRLRGAEIVVTGLQTHDGIALTERNHIDSGLIAVVSAVPGVEHAVPDVTVSAALLPFSAGNQTLGHNWSAAAATPYVLADGQPPVGEHDVVLDAGLAVESGARVGSIVGAVLRGVQGEYRVTGITAPAGVASPALFFPDSTILGNPIDAGRLDSIAVLPNPGVGAHTLAASVTSAVGDRALVLTGDSRGLAEFPAAGASTKTLTILAAIFGSWAMLIAMFGITSMLSLSLAQRQREMALLRAIGTTPNQLRRMLLSETAVLSLIATVLAFVPGFFLGRFLFDELRSNGVVSNDIAFHQGPIPIGVGAALAIAAALGATLVAGRRSANAKPIAALTDSVVQGRWLTWTRLLVALFFLANGITMSVITLAVMKNGPILASTAGPASVLVGIGLALLAPGLVKTTVGIVQWPVRAVSGIAGYLAVRNAMARSVRMAGAVAPIILLVGIATGTLYMQATENSVKAATYSHNLLADFVLTSDDGGFGPDVVDAARRVSGVAGASELVTSDGFVDGRGGGSDYSMRGVSAEGVQQTMSFTAVAGSITDLRSGTVAISQSQAASFGVTVGDTLPLHLGDGAAITPRVVAIHIDDLNDESVLLPASDLARHTTLGLPTQILVRAVPGTDPDTPRSGLDSIAASIAGAEVDDRAALISKNSRVQQILASANYTIVAMIVGYAAITVINSLVAATRTRSKEFGLQRLTGATRAQILGMLGVESGLISIVAIVFGTVAAASTFVPYALVKSGSAFPGGSVGIYLGIVGSAIALTLGATLIPAWRGMRRPPIETVVAPA